MHNVSHNHAVTNSIPWPVHLHFGGAYLCAHATQMKQRTDRLAQLISLESDSSLVLRDIHSHLQVELIHHAMNCPRCVAQGGAL